MCVYQTEIIERKLLFYQLVTSHIRLSNVNKTPVAIITLSIHLKLFETGIKVCLTSFHRDVLKPVCLLRLKDWQ